MYTKHKWESDKYFNFGYTKYLPKDFDENKELTSEYLSIEYKQDSIDRYREKLKKI